ncbi:hypothetical protein FVER53590_25127 [Fusarium verticillioides]|nr:hypothetical protein FVER53590_25127 [Fusarium verticillioides]
MGKADLIIAIPHLTNTAKLDPYTITNHRPPHGRHGHLEIHIAYDWPQVVTRTTVSYGFDNLTDGRVEVISFHRDQDNKTADAGSNAERNVSGKTVGGSVLQRSGTQQTQKNRSEYTRRIKHKAKSDIANYNAWAFDAEEKQEKRPASLEKVVKDRPCQLP